MFVYWLLFAIFALGALRSERLRLTPAPADGHHALPPVRARTDLSRDPLLIAACLFTVVAIGFRYDVGADWNAYQLIYRMIGRISWATSLETWEPGFVVVNIAAHQLGAGVWLVNLICGAILTYGLLQLARLQPNAWLAILVAVPYLVIVVGMGYTRQAVAIGCCMAGLAAASRGSLLKVVLWIILGSLFHRTAVVILPLVLFAFTRSVFQTVLLALFTAVVAYYVLGAGLDRFERLYVKQLYVAQGTLFRLLMNVPPAILFLAMARRFSSSPVERSIWRSFSIAALASMAAWFFIESNVALDRLALYLIPLQIFVFSRLPNVISRGPVASGGAKALIIFYSLAVQLLWFNFAGHAQYWIPYRMSAPA